MVLIAYYCISCQYGDHDGHYEVTQAVPEGVIGGARCDCKGECSVCADAPHGRDCDCHVCADYWSEIAEQSKAAAERANRRLVCTCGWTGAFIEHHNSMAYGDVAIVGCEMVYRLPRDESERLMRKVWTGAEWADYRPPVIDDQL